MLYTIYEGTKATLEGSQFTFSCEPNDIDTAYNALAENVHLNNQSQNSEDLLNFQNAKDDNVKIMLDDMKQMGFIGNWEATNLE